MKRLLFLILVIVLGIACQPVLADPPDEADVDEIQLRAPLELERAVMEYMLAFEAYTAARKSKDKAVRSRLVKLMQEYRNAYARFLEMLREDKLYRPNKPKDPAGWYDKKHEKTKGYKRDWKKTDAKEIRAEVKEMVKNGASPEQIKAFIQSKLPAAPMSSDPGLYPNPNPPPPDPLDRPNPGDLDWWPGKYSGAPRPAPGTPGAPTPGAAGAAGGDGDDGDDDDDDDKDDDDDDDDD